MRVEQQQKHKLGKSKNISIYGKTLWYLALGINHFEGNVA